MGDDVNDDDDDDDDDANDDVNDDANDNDDVENREKHKLQWWRCDYDDDDEKKKTWELRQWTSRNVWENDKDA